MVSLPGQALAAQTLSIKGREERVKEMGVMSSSVHSPGDHDEESLPLPPGRYKDINNKRIKIYIYINQQIVIYIQNYIHTELYTYRIEVGCA